MIYLDNAATTKPDLQALERAGEFLNDNYFNPSALYKEGFALQCALKQSREKLVSYIGDAFSYDLTFTSCGTEADNTAVFGYARRGNAVTSAGEHAAVLSAFSELKNRGVAEPRYAPLKKSGGVDEDKLLAMIDDKTSFVSVMHVNNETGAVNDIAAIAKRVKAKNPRVVFHSDGVQAYGKIPFRLTDDIDLYSVSAHKIGGIKGTGALIRKKSLAFRPYIFGGGQESGRRSGTENVFGIKAFEYAAERKFSFLQADAARVAALRERLFSLLDKRIFIRLSPPDASPYILSVSAQGCRGEILLHMADDRGLLIGTGSACSSNAKARYSRVILACGYNESVADGVLRLSFSPLTTEAEAEESALILNDCARELLCRTK
ncbi:MAG: cysteine desulfurase family protein [Candidatus Borkfalkiaceae bacterium]|nr:cysteine desulfurase family protein [Clostridia bacterium]MDY6222807.1 cysteine desulfurase family protein [Christensenellaceae bacterium]